MIPHLMNCSHSPEGWCSDCAKELGESTIPRATIADALPESWYADSPIEFRVQKMVEQWQKLHEREKQVATALAKLRTRYYRKWAAGEDRLVEEAMLSALEQLDATIAKLGLEVTQ